MEAAAFSQKANLYITFSFKIDEILLSNSVWLCGVSACSNSLLKPNNVDAWNIQS